MEHLTNRRVLIVDDNQAIHEDFRKILGGTGSAGAAAAEASSQLDALDAELFGDESPAPLTIQQDYELSSATQGEEALRLVTERAARGEHFALAFVDMVMPPGLDGLATIMKLWEIDPEIHVVICSAYSTYTWDRILAHFGVNDRLLILKKPFDRAEVAQLACALVRKWELARQAQLHFSEFEHMVAAQTRDLKATNAKLRREIAERKEIENALRASESRYALAAAGSKGGLWDWDLAADTVYYSSRWKAMCGFADDAIGSTPKEWLERVDPDDLERLRGDLRGHLEGISAHFECEYRMRHKDGHYRWMQARGLAVRDDRGRAIRIAGSQNDVTDRRLAEDRLRHDALHDALTGLPNRMLLSDRLRRCLLRARRDPTQRFAVLFLDLDHFKLTNDTLGHLAGDRLLIEVARRLSRCVRATDSIAHDTLDPSQIARLGGDEFVVLLEGMRHDADVIRVALRLQDTLSSAFVIEGKEIFVSISLGIALGRPDYSNPEDLLRDADTALYQAKANGRNCYAVFDSDMHAAVLSRFRIENDLHNAIERNELRLVYQPVVSLATGELREFEALLRWQHPQRGAIPPGDFIPIAEESSLITALGRWVLRSALGQLQVWSDSLVGLADFSLAVNVSGKQMSHPDFIAELTESLRIAGESARRVRLEVTESALMTKGLSASALKQIDALGLRFHLDDFGTGYSSLGYLHRLPVEALKIDRTFVRDMVSDPASQSIVESIILLAHALGAHVIAEGVETQAQADRLRALHCDYAQGYLFSRPLELAAATEYLEAARSSHAARAAREVRPSSLARGGE